MTPSIDGRNTAACGENEIKIETGADLEEFESLCVKDVRVRHTCYEPGTKIILGENVTTWGRHVCTKLSRVSSASKAREREGRHYSSKRSDSIKEKYKPKSKKPNVRYRFEL